MTTYYDLERQVQLSTSASTVQLEAKLLDGYQPQEDIEGQLLTATNGVTLIKKLLFSSKSEQKRFIVVT